MIAINYNSITIRVDIDACAPGSLVYFTYKKKNKKHN